MEFVKSPINIERKSEIETEIEMETEIERKKEATCLQVCRNKPKNHPSSSSFLNAASFLKVQPRIQLIMKESQESSSGNSQSDSGEKVTK